MSLQWLPFNGGKHAEVGPLQQHCTHSRPVWSLKTKLENQTHLPADTSLAKQGAKQSSQLDSPNSLHNLYLSCAGHIGLIFIANLFEDVHERHVKEYGETAQHEHHTHKDRGQIAPAL